MAAGLGAGLWGTNRSRAGGEELGPQPDLGHVLRAAGGCLHHQESTHRPQCSVVLKCHRLGQLRAHSILPAAEEGGRGKAPCSALSHSHISNESCKGRSSPRWLPSLNSASLTLSAAQPRIQVYI